jgi:hypothetical protein
MTLNRYRVHSANEENVAVAAKMDDGTLVPGALRVLLVELVSDKFGTFTHREVIPNEDTRKASRELFEIGAEFEVALKRIAAAPKAGK